MSQDRNCFGVGLIEFANRREIKYSIDLIFSENEATEGARVNIIKEPGRLN